MNITDSIQSFFGGDGAARLGQVAGLDAQTAQRVLSAGLPLQLDALADHARGAQGQAQIAEAIQNLPQFGSVQEALEGADGPQNLQQAGDLLGSVLLGDRGATLTQTVAAQTGAAGGGVQKMLGMALPLLLSQLGRAGVNGGNVGGMLGGLKGQLGGLLGAGAGATALGGAALSGVGLGGALGKVAAPDLTAPTPVVPDIAPPAVNVPSLDTPRLDTPRLDTPVPGAAGAATLGVAAGTAAGMAAGVVARDDSAAGLLEFLKGQFSGPAAERIGTSAGFGGGASRRAAQAALPLILNSLVNKGRTEAGAQDVLNMARPFEPLADTDGHLNTAVLDDAAESARIEGQGRGLLGGLFGNVDQVAGRLGTALGGSGASAGRLLALMTPLVLGVLGNRARSGGLGAAGFSGVLGGMGAGLAGLLPSGLSSLGALLGAGGLAAAGTAAAMAGAPRPAVPPVAPAPVPPAGTPPTPPEEKRRGGFPWWIIPLLLLLLLGGCWLVNRPSTDTAGTATTATDTAASILVTNPSSDANLPPQPFTMSGTGPAGATLTIQDEGQDVGTATVGDDGNWSADLPAPTVGEHTYTVDSGSARSEFKVNITEGADGAAPADDTSGDASGAADDGTDMTGTDTTGTDTTGTDTTGTDADGAATPAAFAISAPTADQELPAGGFTMNGTGTPGEEVELFEDGTSLGKVTIGEDGTWTFDVPSPAAGAHTYSVNGPDGTELGTVSATVAAASADASAADCTEDYTLSITDGQTVSEPFRFGGVGQGEGYSVTVKRGDRTIGTKAIPLDATCGWSYQSRPGAGTITYEVRPTGDAAAEPLSSVTLTVKQ
ncbi:hypothetical protein GCM10008959_26470 [Deinococcus seoulensis]|uniref:DUF937 domain-containing protein n=1 Tax=Deinococcus seoulensis TaxID=1837379 RepID=A0ABQ2RWF7_9DEIO|nr:DUF937 domain-containing protein [Deinococcus seoulensis]GGR63174.1 hypothetical protein GCM10008959_26470 [Deinococcus seoulensis]